MKLALSIACVFALSSTAGLRAQNRPDFSGTWTMDLTRSEAAAQGMPIGPVTVVIRQMPEELRIDTTRNGRTESVRYLPADMKATGGSEAVGAFRWQGLKLSHQARHRHQQAGDYGGGSAEPRCRRTRDDRRAVARGRARLPVRRHWSSAVAELPQHVERDQRIRQESTLKSWQ